MRRSGWGPPEKDPHSRAPRRRPTSTLRYGLSYRDVEELLAERGIDVDHVTVNRWVQRFTPLLTDAARFSRHAPGDR
jgi:transposase-like protein